MPVVKWEIFLSVTVFPHLSFFFGALTLPPPSSPPILSADTQPGMRCGRRAGLELVDGASLPPSQSSTTVREGE